MTEKANPIVQAAATTFGDRILAYRLGEIRGELDQMRSNIYHGYLHKALVALLEKYGETGSTDSAFQALVEAWEDR